MPAFVLKRSFKPRRARVAHLLAATALAGFASLAVPLIGPGALTAALADGGRGGNSDDNWALGGNGGSDGQPGSTGGTPQFGVGGGGGGGGGGPGGAAGGSGGVSANGEPGGAGGASSGAPDGDVGTAGVTGGGGGGGYGGQNGSTAPVLSGIVSGGNGGAGGVGGLGSSGAGGGGGGGAGGHGAVISASGSNTGVVTGGNGGNGGTGGDSAFGNGGNGGYGGAGGIGIQITASGTTLVNSGTISGGNGGVAGAGGAGGFAGASGQVGVGGIGVVGSGITIDNTGGTISGGRSNGGIGVRGRGVQFTGGANAIGGGAVIGDILVSNNSSFAPTLATSAIGTGAPVVTGSVLFTSGSQYVVRVSPAASDSLTVSGNAILFGARVNAQYQPGAYVSRQYTILTAASGLGGQTFAGLDNNNQPANTTASLSYTATSVLLNLALNFSTPGGTLSTNQQNVANAVTNYFNSTGGVPAAFTALTPEQLSQAAGETTVSSQQTTFSAMNQFMGLLGDRTIEGRGEQGGAQALPFADNASLSYASARKHHEAFAAIDRKVPLRAAPFEARWSLWAAGFGGSQTTNGDAVLGSSRTTSRVYGVAAGADYRLTPDTLAGFALAGGGTSFGVGDFGSGRSDLFQAGAYARHNMGAAYLNGVLAYGWQDVTTERTVGADRLQGRFHANAFSGRLEGGYRFATPFVGVTPYAAAQFVALALPGYSETATAGLGTFALDYASKNVTTTRTELGLRTDKSFAVDKAVLALRGRAAWAHDYNNDRNVSATFQALPGATFVSNGATQPPNAVLLTASADMSFRNGWSVAGTFDGEFSAVTRSYAGRGAVRYAW